MPNHTDLPGLRAEFKRVVPRNAERCETVLHASRGHLVQVIGGGETTRNKWRAFLELGWLRYVEQGQYIVSPIYERTSWR